jgi:single-strand DNA-binding protein
MILTGVTRIGNDPAVRYTPNNDPVLELSLAYNHGKKQDDGKRPTQWVSATLWGPRAERVAPHLTKGTQVFVSCSDVFVKVYKKKDGTDGYSLSCRIDNLEFVSGGKGEEPKAKTAPAKSAGFNELEDDIPF